MPIAIPIRVIKIVKKTYRRLLKEFLSIREKTNLFVNLSKSVSIIERFVHRMILRDLLSIGYCIKIKILLFEDIILSLITKIALKLRNYISLYERLVINLMVHDTETIVKNIKINLSLLENLLQSEIIKVLISLRQSILTFEKLKMHLFMTDIQSISSKISLVTKQIESALVNELQNIYLKITKNVSASDFLKRTHLFMKESYSILKSMKMKISNLVENITLSDLYQTLKLKLSSSVTLSENLYYEVYPFVYSLDIVTGYPSKTFPSLDITSTEVKTYGEVTIS